MYLNTISMENVGPIESLRISIKRPNSDVAPSPLLLVGENGSGKTMLLATVADALYEFGASAFRDVLPEVSMGHQYFKVTGGTNQRIGANYSFSIMEFASGDTKLVYVDKSGALTLQQLHERLGRSIPPAGGWDINGNVKSVTDNKAIVESEFLRGAYCFFPANRFEPPHWINPPVAGEIAGFKHAQRFSGMLSKPIAVDSASAATFQWLLDVVLDNYALGVPAAEGHMVWRSMNQIVQSIMNMPNCRLGVGRRGSLGRLAIGETDAAGKWARPIAPTLSHLSAGQNVLLNMFATILRYADIGGVAQLGQVEGIAVIDEVDLHLHSQHQLEVLPRLIALLPKVQFVMSTHSPLVLLGLTRALGESAIQIVDLPRGQNIQAEAFSEFQVAFDAFRNTRSFQEQLERLSGNAKRPTVYVEGELDEKYIKKALSVFGRTDLIERLDVLWIGQQGPQGPRFTGKSGLNSALGYLEANPASMVAPVVLLYDCDANKLDSQSGRLFVRSVPKNVANKLVEEGIENALAEGVFEDRFFVTTVRPDKKGGSATIRALDKSALCEFLCNERRVSNEKERADFAGFQPLLGILDAIPLQ